MIHIRSGNRDEEVAKLSRKTKELTSQLLELQTINVDQEIMIQSMKDVSVFVGNSICYVCVNQE